MRKNVILLKGIGMPHPHQGSPRNRPRAEQRNLHEFRRKNRLHSDSPYLHSLPRLLALLASSAGTNEARERDLENRMQILCLRFFFALLFNNLVLILILSFNIKSLQIW